MIVKKIRTTKIIIIHPKVVKQLKIKAMSNKMISIPNKIMTKSKCNQSNTN
jgi:hypothetical protein